MKNNRYLGQIEMYIYEPTDEKAIESIHAIANQIKSDFDNEASAISLVKFNHGSLEGNTPNLINPDFVPNTHVAPQTRAQRETEITIKQIEILLKEQNLKLINRFEQLINEQDKSNGEIISILKSEFVGM